MATNEGELKARLLQALGEALLRRVQDQVGSATIRRSLRVQVRGNSVRVYTPYYWARYYHDGRRAVRARPGHFIVFFLNPANDPRLRGGRPRSVGDVRRLTRQQLKRAVDSGQAIVTKSVGPVEGTFFFPRAAAGLTEAARAVVRRELDRHASVVFQELRGIAGGQLRLRL